MKNKILVALSVFASISSAHATCWEKFCLNYVPMYDQTSTKIPAAWFPAGVNANSNLCVPTSASMALEGLVTDLAEDNIVTSGTVKSSITGLPMASQIQNMATLMGTSVTEGSDGNIYRPIFAARAADFRAKIMGSMISVAKSTIYTMQGITLAMFIKEFRGAEVRMLASYGHYNNKGEIVTTPTLIQKTLTYERKGGHAISPRGYSVDHVFINDPYAVLYATPLNEMLPALSEKVEGGVTKRSQIILPSGVKQASEIKYKAGGAYHPILEAVTTLSAPFAD